MKDLEKYGFRKGFSFENRFDLKNEINGYLISTVDLGIDHSFGTEKPLYYETMIFKKDGSDIDFNDLYCERYSTEEEAIKGHEKAIEYVRKNLVDKGGNE